jgi:hypothetical protein
MHPYCSETNVPNAPLLFLQKSMHVLLRGVAMGLLA